MKEDNTITTPSYCEGKEGVRVAFVFICPGKIEEGEERPVAGQTGENLTTLLDFLNESNPSLFPYKNRYDYRILNLSEEVFYKEKNGRTIPPLKNIRNDENVNRIVQQIGDCEIVIFFSKNKTYSKVINKIKKRLKVEAFIQVMHLGFQSINRNIKYDKNNKKLIPNQEGNTSKRIEVIAEKIKKELKL